MGSQCHLINLPGTTNVQSLCLQAAASAVTGLRCAPAASAAPRPLHSRLPAPLLCLRRSPRSWRLYVAFKQGSSARGSARLTCYAEARVAVFPAGRRQACTTYLHLPTALCPLHFTTPSANACRPTTLLPVSLSLS